VKAIRGVQAEIAHLNVRKVGEDKETLACDVKIGCVLDSAVVCELMADSISEAWLWNTSGEVRCPSITQIALGSIIGGATVEMVLPVGMPRVFHGVTAKKFVVTPVEGMRAQVTCSLTMEDLNAEKELSLWADRVSEGVVLNIIPPAELPLDSGAG